MTREVKEGEKWLIKHVKSWWNPHLKPVIKAVTINQISDTGKFIEVTFHGTGTKWIPKDAWEFLEYLGK